MTYAPAELADRTCSIHSLYCKRTIAVVHQKAPRLRTAFFINRRSVGAQVNQGGLRRGRPSSCTSTSACSDSGSSAASSKTLVAYYSAQGHTRTVAQTLADELGADLFTIDNDFTGKGPSPSAPPRRPAWANRSRRSRRPLTAESGKTASASRLAQAKTRSAPGQRRCSAKSGAIE